MDKRNSYIVCLIMLISIVTTLLEGSLSSTNPFSEDLILVLTCSLSVSFILLQIFSSSIQLFVFSSQEELEEQIEKKILVSSKHTESDFLLLPFILLLLFRSSAVQLSFFSLQEELKEH